MPPLPSPQPPAILACRSMKTRLLASGSGSPACRHTQGRLEPYATWRVRSTNARWLASTRSPAGGLV